MIVHASNLDDPKVKSDFLESLLSINGTEREIHNVAMHFMQHRQDAEDVVQDVYVILLHRGLDQYDPKKSFEPWVKRVTANRAKTALRHRYKKVFGNYFVDSDDEEFNIFNNLRNPDEKGSLDLIIDGERKKVLRRYVTKIPKVYRNTFVRYWFRGQSYKQIAEIEEIPIGTVKSRMGKAKRLLKESLN